MEANQIRQDVAQAIGVSVDKLIERGRKREIIVARFLILWIYVRKLKLGLIEAGQVLGTNFDHTNVIHARKSIDNWLQTDDSYLRKVLTSLYVINPEYRYYFGETKPKYSGQLCYAYPTNLLIIKFQ